MSYTGPIEPGMIFKNEMYRDVKYDYFTYVVTAIVADQVHWKVNDKCESSHKGYNDIKAWREYMIPEEQEKKSSDWKVGQIRRGCIEHIRTRELEFEVLKPDTRDHEYNWKVRITKDDHHGFIGREFFFSEEWPSEIVTVASKTTQETPKIIPTTCITTGCTSAEPVGYNKMCWTHNLEHEAGIASTMKMRDTNSALAKEEQAKTAPPQFPEPYETPVTVGTANMIGKYRYNYRG